MAMSWPPSPLLALPQELRTKIYEELLCLAPGNVHPLRNLWHDRTGRGGPLNLYPSILCVNKQIHFETIPLLYDKNVFQLDLATNNSIRYDSLENNRDHPILFRNDTASIPLRSDEPAAVDTDLVNENAVGFIHAHSLQRLRHIWLKTSKAAVWGRADDDGEARLGFPHTRLLIIRILQLLSEHQCAATSVRQTFKFIVVPDWLTMHGVFAVGRSDMKDDSNVIEMLQLFRQIQQTRFVEVEEYVRPAGEGGYQRLKKVEVDVEARLAQFLELGSDVNELNVSDDSE
jgi:hypothetical protein